METNVERNIFDIAKKQHLIVSIDEEIAKNRVDIDAGIEKIQKDPAYGLEWSNDLFRNAATDFLLKSLRWIVERTAKDEWTMEELRQEVAKSNLRHGRAVPCSTSATSNLMEQNKLEAYLKFVHGDSFSTWFFNRAQRQDEEYKEASKAEYEREKAERDAAAARAEEQRKLEQKQKRAERRAARSA
jgi:hypothetical protein